MAVITSVLATLVALEFFFIMYLETIATTSDLTSKVFGMKKKRACAEVREHPVQEPGRL